MSIVHFPVTARLQQLEAERAKLIAAVMALLPACPVSRETIVERRFAERALASVKGEPDRHQLYPPSIDRRNIEDLFE